MFYHSKYSNDFVGLRTTLGGGKQILREINDGSRVLLNICDLKFSNTQIDEALKEASLQKVFLVVSCLHLTPEIF